MNPRVRRTLLTGTRSSRLEVLDAFRPDHRVLDAGERLVAEAADRARTAAPRHPLHQRPRDWHAPPAAIIRAPTALARGAFSASDSPARRRARVAGGRRNHRLVRPRRSPQMPMHPRSRSSIVRQASRKEMRTASQSMCSRQRWLSRVDACPSWSSFTAAATSSAPHVRRSSPAAYSTTAPSLAESTGNVVVTVQYRLGPLGWLAHPTLDAEAPDSRSGNYALEDLVAALQWVQRDIGAFGGNKDRVMIFGESAGGVNVCALLATPAAAGLYDAALIQSGGCVADSRADALSTGATLAANAGCGMASDVAACLRSKSPAALLAALPPTVSIVAGRRPSSRASMAVCCPQHRSNGLERAAQSCPGRDRGERRRDGPGRPVDVLRRAVPGVPDHDVPDARRTCRGRRPVFGRQLRIVTQGLCRAYVGPQAQRSSGTIASAIVAADPNQASGISSPRCRTREPRQPMARFTDSNCCSSTVHSMYAVTRRPLRNAPCRWPCSATGAASRRRAHPSRRDRLVDTVRSGADSHLVLDSASMRMAEGVNTARCKFWAQFGL